jgi:hypothetical protein
MSNDYQFGKNTWRSNSLKPSAKRKRNYFLFFWLSLYDSTTNINIARFITSATDISSITPLFCTRKGKQPTNNTLTVYYLDPLIIP